jgi:hypothetical protein
MENHDEAANEHATKISEELLALAAHLRRDLAIIQDSKAKALFETSAEVILGLNKAFTDYLEKKETVWK